MEAKAPLEKIASVAVGLLGLMILVDLLAIGSSFLQIELLEEMAGGMVDQARAESNDARQQAIGRVYLVLFIAAAITWLIWFSRAYRNIDVFGGERSRTPKWAVWGYIIPFISLYLPYRMMREAFTASAPAGEGTGRLVGWWWGIFLLNGFLGQASLRLFLRADDIDALITATWVSIAENIWDIPSALLAIAVVRTLTRWQTEREAGNINLAKVFD